MSNNLSYWEYKTWLSNIDYTIVGSGIVGLSCALGLRKRFPKAKILVLERGILPQGASTKNAGFACFGSISEILADIKTSSEWDVQQLVHRRWRGIQLLRTMLGDDNLNFLNYGGHEVFLKTQESVFHHCLDNLNEINQLLEPVFKALPFSVQPNRFNFAKIQPQYITHAFESQIDTGKMMSSLVHLAHKQNIILFNGITVKEFVDHNTHVEVRTDHFEMITKKLCIATNGFASQLLHEDVVPARAQVLITKPIAKLPIKGTFHLDEGYYYFRNVGNRLLFGGGRNLDFEGEKTMNFGQTKRIQQRLEFLLSDVILPDTPFEIDQRWSGIMGTGREKRPIVKQFTNHVYCGVRLGGMGIALGSLVGKEMAELL
ncbi:FAD-dependent oxidoreductase [Arenibacter sp. GZD96]|uniref:NAD(P)/FAD-dependent oxidoreductase n=1 Tax=Aurantibrevibacter litoralis TaxID=3106030 RepID=UPI002AFE72ED|nr:FAD-dependent oxidoreductase [Arenibacter sp. GZD-96]MEA1784463.1 FAD-dependent oxidoreductase [Arenibacter sp. GZD-96]